MVCLVITQDLRMQTRVAARRGDAFSAKDEKRRTTGLQADFESVLLRGVVARSLSLRDRWYRPNVR